MGYFSELDAEQSDEWAAYQDDLDCRMFECQRIIDKVSPFLTESEIKTLKYECGLTW